MYAVYQESFDKGHIPEDLTQFPETYFKTRKSSPQTERIPNPFNATGHGKVHRAYRCQATPQRLEDRKIVPADQGGFRPGTYTWEKAATFAYYMYEGVQRKENKLAVAIDIEDAYNRVQFKFLMGLLVQYGVILTLTRWIAGAPLERTVVMQLGNWSSATHQLTRGLPQ